MVSPLLKSAQHCMKPTTGLARGAAEAAGRWAAVLMIVITGKV